MHLDNFEIVCSEILGIVGHMEFSRASREERAYSQTALQALNQLRENDVWSLSKFEGVSVSFKSVKTMSHDLSAVEDSYNASFENSDSVYHTSSILTVKAGLVIIGDAVSQIEVLLRHQAFVDYGHYGTSGKIESLRQATFALNQNYHQEFLLTHTISQALE